MTKSSNTEGKKKDAAFLGSGLRAQRLEVHYVRQRRRLRCRGAPAGGWAPESECSSAPLPPQRLTPPCRTRSPCWTTTPALNHHPMGRQWYEAQHCAACTPPPATAEA